MRFVGTNLVGTLVGTTPENGLKMRYFGSFFGKFIPTRKQEKCPRCLIFTHLGHFTKAEREGFEDCIIYEISRISVFLQTTCELTCELFAQKMYKRNSCELRRSRVN